MESWRKEVNREIHETRERPMNHESTPFENSGQANEHEMNPFRIRV